MSGNNVVATVSCEPDNPTDAGEDLRVKRYDLDEGLNWIGFGWGQCLVIAITGWVYAADAMEMIMISLVLPELKSEWELKPWQTPVLIGVIFLGALVASFPSGMIADRYGRKLVIYIMAVVGCLAGLASAIAPTFYTFLITRFMVGFSVGGGAPNAFSLFAEQIPTNSRGFWLIFFELSWTVGSIIEALLAWVIIPNYGWRWLLGVTSAPLMLVVILLPLINESPRFYLAVNKQDKAMAVLNNLATLNKKALPEGEFINNVDIHQKKGSLMDLVSNMFFIRLTFTMIFLWFASAFIYFGVILYTSEYMATSDNENSVYLSSVVNSLAEVPGYIIACLVIDHIGRIPTLYISFTFCGLAFVALAYPLNYYVDMFVSAFARGAVASGFAALYTYTPEIYPTNCRATALGVCTAAARIGSMATPYIANLLFSVSVVLPVIIYAGTCIVATVLSYLLPAETRGRKMAEVEAPSEDSGTEMEEIQFSENLEENNDLKEKAV